VVSERVVTVVGEEAVLEYKSCCGGGGCGGGEGN
jgi:hypothetical protein